MTLVPLNCPLCSGVFQVESAHAGSEVQCPLCAKTVLIPESIASPAGAETLSAEASPSASPVPAEQIQADHSFPAPPPMPGASAIADAPPMPVRSESPTGVAMPSAASAAPPIPIPEMPSPSAPPVPTGTPPTEEPSAATDDPELPRLTCTDCERLFRVPFDAAGGQVYCPGCNAIVDVPIVLVEAPDVPDIEHVVAPEFHFEEPEETAEDIIERGGIRHLSREERAQARARKNVFMLVTGFLLLLGAIFFLQHFEEFFMGIWERYGPAPVEQGQGE